MIGADLRRPGDASRRPRAQVPRLRPMMSPRHLWPRAVGRPASDYFTFGWVPSR